MSKICKYRILQRFKIRLTEKLTCFKDVTLSGTILLLFHEVNGDKFNDTSGTLFRLKCPNL